MSETVVVKPILEPLDDGANDSSDSPAPRFNQAEWTKLVGDHGVTIDAEAYIAACAAIKRLEQEEADNEREQHKSRIRQEVVEDYLLFSAEDIAGDFGNLAHTIRHHSSSERRKIYDLLKVGIEERMVDRDTSPETVLDTALSWELWGALFKCAYYGESNQDLADHLANHRFNPETSRMQEVESILVNRYQINDREAGDDVAAEAIQSIASAKDWYRDRGRELADMAIANLKKTPEDS